MIQTKNTQNLSDMKQNDKKAKSSDFQMVTSEIKSVDTSSYKDTKTTDLKVNSKVVFSGLGADEVFGGYSRYKTAYVNGGVAQMEQEMSLDLDRIWHRNMGRDDRVISACGKEARFPFLDTNLLQFLQKRCPSSHLCDWEDFRGKGDKR